MSENISFLRMIDIGRKKINEQIEKIVSYERIVELEELLSSFIHKKVDRKI